MIATPPPEEDEIRAAFAVLLTLITMGFLLHVFIMVAGGAAR